MGSRGRKLVVLSALLASVAHAAAGQQTSAVLMRGLDMEQAGRMREAVAAYQQALAAGEVLPAVLGLERVYSQMGRLDLLLPQLDSLIERRPRDSQLRIVQLRSYTSMQRDAEARATFERWLQFAPRDPAPYREYARVLLDENRAGAADTILQRAQRALGSTHDLATELAQMRAALGLWEESARSWREAMASSPGMENAAVFSLLPAPGAVRANLKEILLAAPMEPGARRILAGLELRWSSPRDAWLALRDLPPSAATVEAWNDFAQSAEETQAWLAARDALAAVLARQPSRDVAIRAATDALTGGDAAGALAILNRANIGATTDSVATRVVLPLRIRALSQVGRPAEAERLMTDNAKQLEPTLRTRLQRVVAGGWVKAGDLARARAAIAAAGESEDDQTSGWLALYEGDLATARKGLRQTDNVSADAVTAMALLSRTRADSSRDVGEAFLAIAKGDTAAAADKFVAAARALPDATPLLLAAAARFYLARHDEARSVALWREIVEQQAASPEAAEAELEWARALRRQGNTTDAIAHLEHLILTFPQSALVPQARRELELARNAIPNP